MKENILDVLMYLFENYLYEEDDEAARPQADFKALQSELVDLGFGKTEVGKAFRWLEDLGEQRGWLAVNARRAVRVFTPEEEKKMDAEARGFILFLEHNGVLDAGNRELVIDRAMALDEEEIGIEQLQWVVLMVLFNQPGQEAAFAWMHDLVYENLESVLH